MEHPDALESPVIAALGNVDALDHVVAVLTTMAAWTRARAAALRPIGPAPHSRTLFVRRCKACSTGTRRRPAVAALKQRVVLPAFCDSASWGGSKSVTAPKWLGACSRARADAYDGSCWR